MSVTTPGLEAITVGPKHCNVRDYLRCKFDIEIVDPGVHRRVPIAVCISGSLDELV